MDLQKRTASILDITDPNFDGTFIQATALNPHLALLLDDEQFAYARIAIEQEVFSSLKNLHSSFFRFTAIKYGKIKMEREIIVALEGKHNNL